VIGRIVIDDIRPRTPTGRYPAKAVVGERVTISAAIFKDGHDILAARVCVDSEMAPMTNRGNDEWQAAIRPTRMGLHRIVVQAWTDRHATWARKVETKRAAGQDIDVEIAEGILLLESEDGGDPAIHNALTALKQGIVTPALAVALPGPPENTADFTTAEPVLLRVDRERALVGAWYELFPRSCGGLRQTAARVPAVAGMGFDVLYLPPIHPIGRTYRKGKNNTSNPAIDDPGSPWAIGNSEGGHTSIDPGLGTFEDFSFLLATLEEHGMEVALDYALQCSPDHPWVREHPEWFHHRPDGTIAYAENPPKKYQDIYPLNFWPDDDADRDALWQACKDILDFWISKGVTIFRVDNPHTKPVAFWEWMLPAVQEEHPEAVFLAEAFTYPKMMAKLAEVGFSQSYTYFTWRTDQYGPEGLRAYLEELAGPKADYMRPAFWPNTPDILSGPLREGPPAAFALRMILAATMAPTWGMYSGYELFENAPASPDNEEYLDSEKYEIPHRDWDRPGTLVPLIRTVNAIRRRHRSLQRLRTIRFHHSDNPQIIVYSKMSDDGDDVMLMVVSLDPYRRQEATLGLDLGPLGLPWDRSFAAVDQLSGETYTWTGPNPYVKLEPWDRVAHILHIPEAAPWP
jgi:starch synthase (maltosyl-transferring)